MIGIKVVIKSSYIEASQNSRIFHSRNQGNCRTHQSKGSKRSKGFPNRRSNSRNSSQYRHM